MTRKLGWKYSNLIRRERNYPRQHSVITHRHRQLLKISSPQLEATHPSKNSVANWSQIYIFSNLRSVCLRHAPFHLHQQIPYKQRSQKKLPEINFAINTKVLSDWLNRLDFVSTPTAATSKIHENEIWGRVCWFNVDFFCLCLHGTSATSN